MKKIIYMLLLIQSGLMIAQTETVVTVNGKKVQINPNSIATADNGLTATGTNIQLGGALTKPSVLTTTSAFTLAIAGLQTGALTDQFVTTDANGILRKIANNNWSTKGNAGTVAGTNFIGTTDEADFLIKRGGVQSGLIESLGGGRMNTSFGYQALNPENTGAENSAFGVQALANNTTGQDNVAFGYKALLKNTTGGFNLAIGTGALAENINGNSNIGYGYKALGGNTSGIFNIAIGDNALSKITTDNYNVGIGSSALELLSSGGDNTVIGVQALGRVVNGSNNTVMGYQAGSSYFSPTLGVYQPLTKLSNSVLIGYNAATSSDNEINSIVIGNNAKGRGSNTVQIGDENMTSIGGQVAWSNPSDVRLKKDIVSSTHGIDFVSKLRPVTYHMKKGTTDLQSGFIAQEVETAAKAVNYEFSGIVKPATENEFYSLRYSEFVVPLVKTVQEQQQMIESQNADIAELKAQIQVLLKAAK